MSITGQITNLNTSHVKLQPAAYLVDCSLNKDLNTSHVKLQRELEELGWDKERNLNTSHVKLQQSQIQGNIRQ